MTALLAFLTSRLGLGALAGVFFLGCITLGWNYGVAHRSDVASRKLAASFEAKYTAADRDLSVCTASLAGAEASIQTQNEAIDGLRRASDEATARANASIAAAQDRARAAERRSQSILQERPREGEAVCDAAWRLHRENME